MSVNGRNKGASFEREVASIINQHFIDSDIELPKIERDIEQYRKADRGDLLGVEGWTIECKRYKRPPNSNGLYKQEWWNQVCKASDVAGNKPVLIYKYDFQPIRCVVFFNDVSLLPFTDMVNVVVTMTINDWLKIVVMQMNIKDWC